MVRNTNVEAYDHQQIAGASAEVAIKPHAGVLKRVRVWKAGDATSVVRVYDGPVAGAVQVDELVGTSVNTSELSLYCKNGIYIATVNPNAAMRVTIEYM